MAIKPNDLLNVFIEIAPEFEIEWNSEDNYSFYDDGSFNFHGVCTEFSFYFVDQERFKSHSSRNDKWFANIELSAMKRLFQFLESHLVDDARLEKSDLDNAICTCFLENIAQTEAGDYAREFMGDKSKEYFDQWNV